MNIAFCWAGSPGHHRDFRRSTSLDLWRPLWAIEGTHWWSVQVGPRQADLVRYPPNVTDMTLEIKNFEDTAKILRLADLTITVDTAVLHLAGSLGCRVWGLISTPPDWRWGLTADTTPWYPSALLWRQHPPGNWSLVFDRLAEQLRQMAGREVGSTSGHPPLGPCCG